PRERWSRQPLDLAALKAFDLSLTLEAAALTHEELKLEQVKTAAELIDGVLTVSQFAASLYGGQLTASGSLDVRARPALALDLTAERLQLERLVPALPVVGTIKGPLDVVAKLSSSGLSEADLIAALEGGGRLSGAVEIPKSGGAAPAIGALSALLQDKVRETRALAQLADAPLTLLGGGADLSGTFTVEKGVARTDDTHLDGKSGAEALLVGEADLPRWLLDAELAIAQREGTEPDLVVAARGPLDQPDVRLRGTAVSDRPRSESPTADPGASVPGPASEPRPLVNPAPGESPSNSAQPGGQQRKRPLTPQEIIEQGLKGLLPGLD
ncbi:MAG: AsmA family protein, partial [Kiloniellales bacterium]